MEVVKAKESYIPATRTNYIILKRWLTLSDWQAEYLIYTSMKDALDYLKSLSDTSKWEYKIIEVDLPFFENRVTPIEA